MLVRVYLIGDECKAESNTLLTLSDCHTNSVWNESKGPPLFPWIFWSQLDWQLYFGSVLATEQCPLSHWRPQANLLRTDQLLDELTFGLQVVALLFSFFLSQVLVSEAKVLQPWCIFCSEFFRRNRIKFTILFREFQIKYKPPNWNYPIFAFNTTQFKDLM